MPDSSGAHVATETVPTTTADPAPVETTPAPVPVHIGHPVAVLFREPVKVALDRPSTWAVRTVNVRSGAGQAVLLVDRSDTRTSVLIRNTDAVNSVWVSPDDSVIAGVNSWEIAAGGQLTLENADVVWAVAISGAPLVAVLTEWERSG